MHASFYSFWLNGFRIDAHKSSTSKFSLLSLTGVIPVPMPSPVAYAADQQFAIDNYSWLYARNKIPLKCSIGLSCA